MRRTALIILLIPLAAAGISSARELADLAAERPGFSTPSTPVGLGIFQVEQGYTFEWARVGAYKFNTISAMQSTVRFGITRAIELRFSTVGYTSQWVRDGNTVRNAAGRSDCLVGAKVRLVKQGAMRPEIAVIGNLSMPVRESPFTSSGYDPFFTVAADKDLPRKFSLIANANFASITSPQGRIYSSGESVWLTKVMAPVSPFVEVFHTTIGPGLGSEVVVDAGLFRNLGKHMQINLEAGHTITGERPSLSASIGLVIRVPEALLGPERYRFHRP